MSAVDESSRPGIAGAATVAMALTQASAALGGEARVEAELLLARALGRPRAWLIAHAHDRIDAAAAAAFAALLARRIAGEPVAYLLGRRGFWSFDLQVTPAVLIPRADSERLVECALTELADDRPLRVVDLGTGSGALALAIARERPLAEVVAIDASAAALAVACANADEAGLSARLQFVQGDWLMPLAVAGCDAIVSNPPYIAVGDRHLREGDLRFEPAQALVAGVDGLDAIRVIVRDAPRHLRAGGWLWLEHGFEQAAAVRALLAAAGFVAIVTHRDLEGRERVSGGRTVA